MKSLLSEFIVQLMFYKVFFKCLQLIYLQVFIVGLNLHISTSLQYSVNVQIHFSLHFLLVFSLNIILGPSCVTPEQVHRSENVHMIFITTSKNVLELFKTCCGRLILHVFCLSVWLENPFPHPAIIHCFREP